MKCTHYLSSLCILVSTRCSCTFSPHIEADFSSWGGFKTDGKPSKSTHLSPTNIPMMANYPSYTATCPALPVQMCGGGGWGGGGGGVRVFFCCGAAACVFRSRRSQSFVPQTATRLTGTRWNSKRSVFSRLHSLKCSSQFVSESTVYKAGLVVILNAVNISQARFIIIHWKEWILTLYFCLVQYQRSRFWFLFAVMEKSEGRPSLWKWSYFYYI